MNVAQEEDIESLEYVTKSIGDREFGRHKWKLGMSRTHCLYLIPEVSYPRGQKKGKDIYWHFHRNIYIWEEIKKGNSLCRGTVVIADKDKNEEKVSFQNRLSAGVIRISILLWSIPEQSLWGTVVDLVKEYCSHLQRLNNMKFPPQERHHVVVIDHNITFASEIHESSTVKSVQSFFQQQDIKVYKD